MTPEEMKEYQRNYYLKNREEYKERARANYYANHEENKKKHRERSKALDQSEQYRKYGRRGLLKRAYGITEEEYEALIVSQGNKCAICGCDLASSKTTHLDHDHETNAIRGVLCINCNNGLGHFKDSPERLRLAAEYLESFSK